MLTSSPLPRLAAATTALVLALGLLTPTAALADGTALVTDCADDGQLSKRYTPGEYADALKHIPTDVDEYTDCRDVIRRGQLGLGGSGSGSGSGTGSGAGAGFGSPGGGDPGGGGETGAGGGSGSGLDDYNAAIAGASPAERASVDKAIRGTTAGVTIGGRELRPSTLDHGGSGTLSTLPTPLVIVLLLLALGILAAAVPTIRTVVRTRTQRTA